MSGRDLRSWMHALEQEGELCRVSTEVDWNLELAEILRRSLAARGPAILFENISGHRDGWCTKLFANALGTRGRIAMMLGLPKDATHAQMVTLTRKRLREPVAPVVVQTGPVKENVISGDAVDLTQMPVPFWHEFDGGRYINTWCAVVTRDPDTGALNVGTYRGMIAGRNKISVFLEATRDWGRHYAKYCRRGEPMPVAVVYGWDPSMVYAAGHPFGGDEYGIMGAIRQEPVELVRCDTSDLLVPASAEIVLEGFVSTDPESYLMEGPFGEFSGYYGGFPRARPVIEVQRITHRTDPIYRGNIEGPAPGLPTESSQIFYFGWAAALWEVLESQGHADSVLDVVAGPWTVVKIRKAYEGQARHIGAAIWGSKLITYIGKIVVVCEDDVDIHDARQVQMAIRSHADPARDFVVFPMRAGGSGDTALAESMQDEIKWGSGMQSRILIDATVDWETHPVRPEWGNSRRPLNCTRSPQAIVDLVTRRWDAYGLPAQAKKR